MPTVYWMSSDDDDEVSNPGTPPPELGEPQSDPPPSGTEIDENGEPTGS